ncbi:MAG: hypothetical protein L0177_15120 [Chloroflexi bacterium]|nr:hypothetical protein [Chloroflexota bacterium]
MILTRGDSEFEVSISAVDGEWEGRIVEHTVSRLTPTLHLRHSWTTSEAALAGVQRRWQRLFPDEPVELRPDFHDAITDPDTTDDDNRGRDALFHSW